MSNFSKDQPSIRVFAPPGGRSTNIFGVPEPEPPMSAKKNHMESDIFGCKKDNTDAAPVKQTRNVTNNIFGTEREQPVQKSNLYSDKNKSTIFDDPPPQQQPSNKPDRQRSTIFDTSEPGRQRSNEPDRQRSNIFGTNESVQPVSTRPVSEKFKSNIFGVGDDDSQTKRQQGTRQGLRVGYNPINGESYSTKDGLNSKVEQVETVENEKESNDTVKTPEEENVEQGENGNHKSDENGDAQTPTDAAQNGHSQAPIDKPSNGHTNGSNGHANGSNGHTNGANGHSAAKNSPSNVRIFHPPGGRSNGPLW